MMPKLRKVFVEEVVDSEKESSPCPACAKKGELQFLRFHYISMSESVEKCNSSTCMYPYKRFRYRSVYENTVYRYEPDDEHEAPSICNKIAQPTAQSNVLDTSEILDSFNLNWFRESGTGVEQDDADDIGEFEDYSFGDSGLARFLEMTNDSTGNSDDNAIIEDICKDPEPEITFDNDEEDHRLTELKTVSETFQTEKQTVVSTDYVNQVIASVLIATDVPDVPIATQPDAIPIESPKNPIILEPKKTVESAYPIIKEPKKTVEPRNNMKMASSIKLPSIFKETKKMPTTSFKFNIIRPINKNAVTTKSFDMSESFSSSSYRIPNKSIRSAPTSTSVSGTSTPKSIAQSVHSNRDINSNINPILEHDDLVKKLRRIRKTKQSETTLPTVSEVYNTREKNTKLSSAISTPCNPSVKHKIHKKIADRKKANSSNSVQMLKRGRSRLFEESPPNPVFAKDVFRGFTKNDIKMSLKRCIVAWQDKRKGEIDAKRAIEAKNIEHEFTGYSHTDILRSKFYVRMQIRLATKNK